MYAMCYVQYVLCMLYTVCTMDVHLHTRLALPFFPCSALPCSDCLFCLVLPCLVCLPWFLSCLVLSGLFCPSYPVLSCPVCPVCPILSVLSSPVRPLLSCPSSSIRPLLVLSSSSPRPLLVLSCPLSPVPLCHPHIGGASQHGGGSVCLAGPACSQLPIRSPLLQ